jgi:hypothetical protein
VRGSESEAQRTSSSRRCWKSLPGREKNQTEGRRARDFIASMILVVLDDEIRCRSVWMAFFFHPGLEVLAPESCTVAGREGNHLSRPGHFVRGGPGRRVLCKVRAR